MSGNSFDAKQAAKMNAAKLKNKFLSQQPRNNNYDHGVDDLEQAMTALEIGSAIGEEIGSLAFEQGQVTADKGWRNAFIAKRDAAKGLPPDTVMNTALGTANISMARSLQGRLEEINKVNEVHFVKHTNELLELNGSVSRIQWDVEKIKKDLSIALARTLPMTPKEVLEKQKLAEEHGFPFASDKTIETFFETDGLPGCLETILFNYRYYDSKYYTNVLRRTFTAEYIQKRKWPTGDQKGNKPIPEVIQKFLVDTAKTAAIRDGFGTMALTESEIHDEFRMKFHSAHQYEVKKKRMLKKNSAGKKPKSKAATQEPDQKQTKAKANDDKDEAVKARSDPHSSANSSAAFYTQEELQEMRRRERKRALKDSEKDDIVDAIKKAKVIMPLCTSTPIEDGEDGAKEENIEGQSEEEAGPDDAQKDEIESEEAKTTEKNVEESPALPTPSQVKKFNALNSGSGHSVNGGNIGDTNKENKAAEFIHPLLKKKLTKLLIEHDEKFVTFEVLPDKLFISSDGYIVPVDNAPEDQMTQMQAESHALSFYDVAAINAAIVPPSQSQ